MGAAVCLTIFTTGEEANAPRMNASTQSLEKIGDGEFGEGEGNMVLIVGESCPAGIGMRGELEVASECPLSRSGVSTAETVSAGESKEFVVIGAIAVERFPKGDRPAEAGSVGREGGVTGQALEPSAAARGASGVGAHGLGSTFDELLRGLLFVHWQTFHDEIALEGAVTPHIYIK